MKWKRIAALTLALAMSINLLGVGTFAADASETEGDLGGIFTEETTVPTPTEPGETTPTEPGEIAPTEPGETAPTELGETAPTEPGETAPAESGETAPTESGETAPAQSGETAPALSEVQQAFITAVAALNKASLLGLAEAYMADPNAQTGEAVDAAYLGITDAEAIYAALSAEEQAEKTVAASHDTLSEIKAAVDAVLAVESVPVEQVSADQVSVTYVDADGNSLSQDAAVITDASIAWDGTAGEAWYVVNSDVSMTNRITVTGTVNLILTDGHSLTSTAGITVGSGASLTVYGQNLGTGILTGIAQAADAGIGSGAGNAGTITINGGRVSASCSGSGAGIGGSGGTVTINRGVVRAQSMSGAGISGTFGTGVNGTAIIIASSIENAEDTSGWSGIIFNGHNGGVYGNQTLPQSHQIESGEILTVSAGATLTVPGDKQLTVAEGGTLLNKGTISLSGTLAVSGIAANQESGQLSINGSGAVTKKTQDKPNAPQALLTTKNSVTLAAAEGTDVGAKVQYGKSTTEDGEISWQDGTEFAALTEGTTYYFYVKYLGSDYYAESAQSNALSVSTLSTLSVTAEDYSGKYDGKAHGITVTAPDGAVIVYGTQNGTYHEASITYTDVTNGAKTVYYQVTQEGHETVTGSRTVTISPADAVSPNPPTLTAVTYAVTQTLSDITLPNGWVWAAPETVPTVGNSGYSAEYAVADDTNYDWSRIDGYNEAAHKVTRTVSLQVNPAAVTIVAIQDEAKLTQTYSGATFAAAELFTFDENCGTKSFSLLDIASSTGTGSIAADGTLTVTKAGAFLIGVDTAANGNYAAGQAKVSLTVNKGTGSITNKTSGGYQTTYTYTGSEIAAPQDGNFTTNAGALSYTWYQGAEVKEDAKLSSGRPKDAGTYTLRVTAAETDCYTSATQNVTVNISYLTSDAVATLEDTNKGENEWYTGAVTVNAPNGFTISNTIDGIYAASFTTTTNGTNAYFLKQTATGYITGEKSISVKYDADKPTQPTLAVMTTATDTTVTLTAGSNDAVSGIAQYTLTEKGGKINSVTQNSSNFTLTGLTRNTEYYFAVTAKDNAGNISEPSAECTFTTAKTSLTDAEVMLTGVDSLTYNGTSQTPASVVVTLNSISVDADQYEVAYSSSNGGVGNTTNAGTVTVTVTAKADGNYTGTATQKSYTIAKKSLTAAIATTMTTAKVFDGKTDVLPGQNAAISLSGVVSGDETAVSASASYAYDSPNVKNATKITATEITLGGAKAGCYTLSNNSAEIAASITPAGVSVPAIAHKTYNGTKLTADVATDSKYEITNEGGTDEGNYDVVLTFTDKANYQWASGDDDKNGEITLIFTIDPLDISDADVGTFASLTYTGSEQTPSASVTKNGLTATGSWSKVTDVADTTTFTANGNFIGTIADKNPGMAKRNVSDFTVGTFAALTYNGREQTPGASVTKDSLTATGSWSKVTNVADTTTFTASGNFTGTITGKNPGMAKKTVDALNLNSLVTAPVKNAAPVTAMTDQTQYTGAVSWDGNPAKFLGGTVYTATVTLAATDNYTFTGMAANAFSYAGATVTNNAGSGTVTIVFPKTADRVLSSIAVTGTPQKTTYNIGETFDSTGLGLTVTYDDATTAVITSATAGYSVTPAVMAADTASVVLHYQEAGVTVNSTPVAVSVRENLTSITPPGAVTGVLNGAAKNEERLKLPGTVGIVTSTGTTTTATVTWDVATADYDPAALTAQTFTVNGTVSLPENMSNLQNVALTVQVGVSVLAAEAVSLPELLPDTDDTAVEIVGIQENQNVTGGQKLTVAVGKFVRGEYTYIPVAWQTNPSGIFASDDATTYSAVVNTSGMTAGAHIFTITYREVTTQDGVATGRMVQTKTNYTISYPAEEPATEPTVIYTIVVSAGAGGSFGTGATVSATAGEDVTFTITPDKGYRVANVLVDGKSRGVIGSYTFSNVQADHTISATFTEIGVETAVVGTAKAAAGTEQKAEETPENAEPAPSAQPDKPQTTEPSGESETVGQPQETDDDAAQQGGSALPFALGGACVLIVAAGSFMGKRKKNR